jgi:hypothetical protein
LKRNKSKSSGFWGRKPPEAKTVFSALKKNAEPGNSALLSKAEEEEQIAVSFF